MSDGDFGGGFDGGPDAGAPDGGPLDLNNSGSSFDEFVLFAAVTDGARRGRGGPAPRGGCCALPVLALILGSLLLLLLV